MKIATGEHHELAQGARNGYKRSNYSMAGAADHGANHLGVDVLGGGCDAKVIIAIVADEAKA